MRIIFRIRLKLLIQFSDIETCIPYTIILLIFKQTILNRLVC